jgi:hypothetical protein
MDYLLRDQHNVFAGGETMRFILVVFVSALGRMHLGVEV